MDLGQLATEAARRHGDRPAFVTATGWSVSFAELDQWSAEVAAGLARSGVGPGTVAALTMPSDPSYVVAYLALARLGAITAGINPRFTDTERSRALDVVSPDVVLAPPGQPLPSGPTVLTVPPPSGPRDLLADLRVSGSVPVLSADDDRDVAIVLTSGTTGTPKGAVFTNRGLNAVTAGDIGAHWGGGTDMIASTQFAHVGFMTKLPGQLRTGTTSHLLERWRAADVLDLVARHRIPVIGAVAPQVALMLRDEHFDQRDLSSVQGIIAGAGPSPPDLVREARERFACGYSIRYSSTESGGVGLATAFDAPDEEALFTVGRPRAAVRVEIRDVDHRPLSDGEIGELWLSSPTMLDRYWRAPEETAATIVDGWYRTGDLGLVDATGCIRLAGRRKEMFIRGGYNVYPMEVEAALSAHPAVAEIAIIPRDDAVMGEIGVAVLVPRDDQAPPTLDDLRAAAGTELSAYKLPEAIRVVGELPLTAAGKLDRTTLRLEMADWNDVDTR
jgi:acyl-CoA synthetase (AMP-forming)/AMP-acid ligase II